MVKRNSEKLHALVNQLLEFSRIEAGYIHLAVTEGNLLLFLPRVVQSFQSWAERKHITLSARCEDDPGTGWFDADILEKVLNNLISNALKFTPEGGRVNVSLRLAPSARNGRFEEARIEISGFRRRPRHLAGTSPPHLRPCSTGSMRHTLPKERGSAWR